MHQQISNGFAAGILFLVAASLQMVQAQDAGEPVWNLDPFVVSTDNVGYQARNSLSATKFDIEVRSVPITVTSLTQEYLEDTYSQSIEDAVRFSAGVTRADTVSGEEGDSFFIRGLKTART
ncbi:MAG: TonB-dependent receptor plug domain-containing protein, partial [Oceanipulchritudo sp.]